jgi:hypothetical protein
MADPVVRRAARTAALFAVPAALVAGFVAYQVMVPDSGGPGADSASSTAPVATAPVEVPSTALAGRPALVCRALLARLPERLGSLTRRPVTAGSEQNAAYGDPAVTVACGVPGPTPPGGAQYLGINGLCWYSEPTGGGVTWSLQGREVPLVVTIPAGYTGQDLVDLAKPVRETIPEVAQVCR